MKTAALLKKIIEDKNRGHRRFSLRTLAKKIEIPSGRLSELLNGKRRLTDYYLEKIFVALKLTDQEIADIRAVHYKEFHDSAKSSDPNKEVLISKEHIDQIISWKLYAILSFVETTSYFELSQKNLTRPKQIECIAKSLRIATSETISLIKLMEDVHFLRWDDSEKRWMTHLTHTTTGYDIPSQAIQKYHDQVLDLAKEKLPAVNLTKRDYSSMTLTIDPKDILKAKKMLRDFRQKFTKTLERGRKQEVYQLAIQFFPITDPGE